MSPASWPWYSRQHQYRRSRQKTKNTDLEVIEPGQLAVGGVNVEAEVACSVPAFPPKKIDIDMRVNVEAEVACCHRP